MKKFFALVLAMMMVLSLVACGDKKDDSSSNATTTDTTTTTEQTAASDVTGNLTMGTGGSQGTYYAVGGVLGTVIGQKTKMSVNVVESGGSKDNLQNIQMGLYQLATVQSDVMTYAFEGINSFADSGKIDNFTVLCALYAETVQIVTCNPDIKSVADLKGKSVCVGDVGSGTYFNTVDILAAYDMTIDDVKAVYQSFGDSTESVQDGKIDAAILTAGAPTTAVSTLDAAKNVYLVSIDDEHMAKLLASCPYYASYTIPAGTYPSFNEDATTVTVKATLVASDTVTDEQAYALVSTIFGAKDEITEQHKKGAELDLTFATDGISVPFHAGAAKFYAENSITVATK